VATRRPDRPAPERSLPGKLAGKLEKVARQQEKVAAKAALQAEALQRVAEHVGALDLWRRPAPGTRRPRFTRDEIAATAIAIADAEGFDAVSMRRIATELDAGTMTLYHYVRTKDELLTLLTDTVLGEVVVPDDEPFPSHWRAALGLIAERTRAAFSRHPWIFDITDDPPLGPNGVRHFDQSLQAVASLDLTLPEKFDIVFTVDEYVFGYCLQERNYVDPPGGPHDDDMIDYVQDLITTGDYPQLATIANEVGLGDAWATVLRHLRDPRRFARNLGRLLDGIEANLSR
jgi:AcrR family transcriptional regulator